MEKHDEDKDSINNKKVIIIIFSLLSIKGSQTETN